MTTITLQVGLLDPDLNPIPDTEQPRKITLPSDENPLYVMLPALWVDTLKTSSLGNYFHETYGPNYATYIMKQLAVSLPPDRVKAILKDLNKNQTPEEVLDILLNKYHIPYTTNDPQRWSDSSYHWLGTRDEVTYLIKANNYNLL